MLRTNLMIASLVLAMKTSRNQMQYLCEILPKLGRVALLHERMQAQAALIDIISLRQAAARAQLSLVEYAFDDMLELSAAFAAMQCDGMHAAVVPDSPLSARLRPQIARLARRAKIAFVSEAREFARAGALFTFGPNGSHVFARSAAYARTVLQGAQPTECLTQQPSVFELVVNQKTARLLGLRIPASILANADEVIR